jgi:tellurite resistance protein
MQHDHDEFLEVQRRKLEDAFFQERDKVLIENLKKMQAMKETKESLGRVSGITNDKVLEKLVGLGVRPETLAPLSVIPLVEVAWADGSISKEEEAAVLKAAQSKGIQSGSIEFDLLREWLEKKPPANLLDAWVHYIEGLCEQLPAAEKETMKKEIMGGALAVAETSGGLLGINKISPEEKAVLTKMEKAFS